MRILGIDPGYERLGIAILEKASFAKGYGGPKKEKVIFSECFKTSSKLDFTKRLFNIGERISEIIHKYKPDVLAIETLFLNTNQKTVMRVAEARGVVMYEASRAGLEIFEASPPQIKTATTGYGKASKADINKMVKMLVDVDENKIRQRNGQESDDELDAIAIALTAFACMKK